MTCVDCIMAATNVVAARETHGPDSKDDSTKVQACWAFLVRYVPSLGAKGLLGEGK